MAESDDVLHIPGGFDLWWQPQENACGKGKHDFKLFSDKDLRFISEVSGYEINAYNVDPKSEGIPGSFVVKCVICGETDVFSSDKSCIKCLNPVAVSSTGQIDKSEMSHNFRRECKIGVCQNEQCGLRVTWWERVE